MENTIGDPLYLSDSTQFRLAQSLDRFQAERPLSQRLILNNHDHLQSASIHSITGLCLRSRSGRRSGFLDQG